MTAMVITVASEASYAHESYSTLQFGSRAKQIVVKATVNETVDYKALYEALQARLDAGEDSSTSLSITVQQLEAQVTSLQRECDAAKRVCTVHVDVCRVCPFILRCCALLVFPGSGGSPHGIGGVEKRYDEPVELV